MQQATDNSMKLTACILFSLLPALGTSHAHHPYPQYQNPIPYFPQQHSPDLLLNVPLSIRASWMRVANAALPSSCPFAPFGAAIVNHTASPPMGRLICTGYNHSPQSSSGTGNPTLHGEVAAIDNCTSILSDPDGPYALSPVEVAMAWKDLTPYTNAESCPMCASAIRWAGFREYVFGTSIETLIDLGWKQIDIGSWEIFERSAGLGTKTGYLGDVLVDETDPFFAWQFQKDVPCPVGCERSSTGWCTPF